MSGFGLRRGPNVSQYIANLNHMPSPQDLATQQESFGLDDDDLAAFTNAEFFSDFDVVDGMVAIGEGDSGRLNKSGKESYQDDLFSFTDDPFLSPTPFNLSLSTFPPSDAFGRTTANDTTTTSSFDIPTSPTTIAASTTASSPLEAHSRAAADEDKRRRNTAASARFRVKKKQREQALEQATREMTERTDAMAARISRLETENAWLKSLVVEKNVGGRGGPIAARLVGDAGTDDAQGAGAAVQVAELCQEWAAKVVERSGRKGPGRQADDDDDNENEIDREDDQEQKPKRRKK